MWLKIKNSFIFGHLDIFWVIFTSEKIWKTFSLVQLEMTIFRISQRTSRPNLEAMSVPEQDL